MFSSRFIKIPIFIGLFIYLTLYFPSLILTVSFLVHSHQMSSEKLSVKEFFAKHDAAHHIHTTHNCQTCGQQHTVSNMWNCATTYLLIAAAIALLLINMFRSRLCHLPT